MLLGCQGEEWRFNVCSSMSTLTFDVFVVRRGADVTWTPAGGGNDNGRGLRFSDYMVIELLVQTAQRGRIEEGERIRKMTVGPRTCV